MRAAAEILFRVRSANRAQLARHVRHEFSLAEHRPTLPGIDKANLLRLTERFYHAGKACSWRLNSSSTVSMEMRRLRSN